MSVIKFFSSYLPKPDKNLTLVRNIFEIPLNNNAESDEQKLIRGYPKAKPLDSFPKKMIPQMLIDTLNLKYEDHAKVIKKICKKLEKKKLDIKVRINIGILAVRSCCSLLFVTLDQIDPIKFGLFMKSLTLATDLYPNQQYISDLFFGIFQKQMTSGQIPQILEYVEILQKSELFYSDQAFNFFSAHSAITVNLIDALISKKAMDNYRLISNHFFFTAFILNKTKNPDKQTVQKLSQSVMKLVEFVDENPVGITMNCAILVLMISCRKHYVFDCSAYMDVLRKMCPKNTIFDTKTDESMFHTEELHNIELKFVDSSKYAFTMSNSLPQFNDLLALEAANTNPLLLFSQETGTQMKNADFETFSHILKHLLLFIDDEGLNIYAITLIIITQLPDFAVEIGNYIIANHSFDIFFPHALFDPSISSYTTPESPILNLRKQLFEMLEMLLVNEKVVLPIRKALYNILSLITTHSALFSDIMVLAATHLSAIFSANVQNDGLWDIVFNAMIIQQEHHFAGDKLAVEYRSHLFTAVSKIFKFPQAIERACFSKFSTQAGAHFLFEKSSRFMFINIIHTILSGIATIQKEDVISTFSKVVHELVWYLISSCSNEESFDLLLTVFKTLCETVIGHISIMSNILYKTTLIDDTTATLLNIQTTSPKSQDAICVFLDLLLSMQKSSYFIFDRIPFVSLANIAKKLGINDTIYSKIISLISGGNENFDRIAIPEALPLLIISTQGTPHFPDVLQALLKFCSKSVSNRCACIAGMAPSLLFESVSEEYFDVVLEIFVSISKTGCTHKALITFFRQFSALRNKTFNSKIFKCIKKLLNIVNEAEEPQHFSMVLFCSEYCKLQVQEIPSKDTADDFMISACILLDAPNCGRNFFDFKSKDGFYFRTYFVDNKIEMAMKLNEEEEKKFTFNAELPIQKWFNISLICKHYDESFTLFIDDKQVDTISIKPIPVFPDFTDNSFFNIRERCTEFFSCQLQELVMYAHANNWTIKLPEKMNMQTITSWASEQWNSSDQNKLRNNGTKLFSFEANSAFNTKYSGTTIRFFSNFLKVFEASHSINFIVSLFGQLDFGYDDNEERQLFLENLMQIVTKLIQKSDVICDQMIRCHMYSVISFFLYGGSKKHLTMNIWNSFMEQLECLEKNQELKNMLGKWIIFHNDIWCYAPLTVQCKIFEDWNTIAEKTPDFFFQFVSTQFLLTIFNMMVPTETNLKRITDNEKEVSYKDAPNIEENLSTIHGLILKLCKFSFIKPGNQDDSDFLYQTLWYCPLRTQTLALVDLGSFCIFRPWFHFQEFHFGTTWITLFSHQYDDVRASFMNIFAALIKREDAITEDIIIACASYVATNPMIETEKANDSSDSSLLVNCCRLALGIEEKVSLKELIEKDKPVIQFPKFMLFAFAQAIVSSQEMSDLFVEFLDKLCQTPGNASLIANTMPLYSQFVLVYWAATKAQKAVKSIAEVATCDNAAFLRQILDISDTISAVCNADFDDFIASIINESYEIISKKEIVASTCQAGETLALSLLFHTHVYNHKNVSDFYSSFYGVEVNEKPERAKVLPPISEVMDKFLDKKTEMHQQVFSKRIDENGKWLDWNIAWKITLFLSEIEKKFSHSVIQPLTILLSQFFTRDTKPEDYSELVPILEQQIVTSEIDDFTMFIGYLMTKLPENDVLKPIYDKLSAVCGNNWREDNRFVNGFHAFNNYCDQPPTSSIEFFERAAFISKEVNNFPKKPSAESIKESINTRTEEARKHLTGVIESSSRHWRTLWVSLAHERSPFYEQEKLVTSIHYKRFSMYDRMLRPSLLKRNTRFTFHIEASLKRDAVKSLTDERASDEELFKQNAFFSLPPPKAPTHEEEKDLPDKYIWKSAAEYIDIGKTQHGTFAVSLNGYFFLREEASPIHIPSTTIRKIIFQYILQRPTAVEIFTTSRRSYLFNFPDADSHKFVSFLKAIPLSPDAYVQQLPAQQEIDKFTKKWLQYEISTFEYLMWLNELSGRSMNNIQSYPVFPWVIKDYSSEEIDLDDPNVYRDLSKPIGALGEERLKKLKTLKENSIEPNPFLYRNMYSCAFNILHYLVRLEPFTSIHIKHQDGKFDVPTRLFKSIPESYQNVIDSNTNFRELTPEFFYSSDFLHNTDNFDLGHLEDGTQLSDVSLPKWAKSAEHFIFIHKKALESEYVSQHINEWIDLIWGYKQTGEAADLADNTYDPHLYQDVWQKYTNPEEKDMIEAMLHHIGSIPRKLFDTPHPKRTPRQKIPQQQPFTSIKIADEQILAVKAIGETLDRLSLFILLGNGNVYNYRAYNSSVFPVSKEKFDDIAVASTGESDSPINFTFARSSSSELIVVRSNGSLAKYKSEQHIDSIKSSCVSAERLITGGRDSILVEWKINERGDLSEPKSIMAHANPISCCAASHSYGVAVSCSTDGLLVVSFLTDFSFIRSLDINLKQGFVPQNVLVTEGNGLIIISSGHPRKAVDGTVFSIYTINGILVASINLPRRVGPWCVATNDADLDYLLIVDKHRKVILCDIFTLNTLGTVFECKERITHIGYDRKTDTITIGDQKGSLYIGPLFRSLPFVI